MVKFELRIIFLFNFQNVRDRTDFLTIIRKPFSIRIQVRLKERNAT